MEEEEGEGEEEELWKWNGRSGMEGFVCQQQDIKVRERGEVMEWEVDGLVKLQKLVVSFTIPKL